MHPTSALHKLKIVLHAYLLFSILNINVLADILCGNYTSPQGPPLYSDCLAAVERMAPRPSFTGTYLMRPEMYPHNSCSITVMYLTNPGAYGLRTEYTSTNPTRIWLALMDGAKEVIQQCIRGPRATGSGFLSTSIVFEGREWDSMLKVFRTPIGIAPPPNTLPLKLLSIVNEIRPAATTYFQRPTASRYSVGAATSSAAPKKGVPKLFKEPNL